jgi:transposase-like protein
MPWKEVNPMQQRILFIADYLRQISNVRELCRQYGISRKTAYKWIARYQEHEQHGLQTLSSKPLNSPQQMPHSIQKAFIELRQQFMEAPGPKSGGHGRPELQNRPTQALNYSEHPALPPSCRTGCNDVCHSPL